MKTPETNVIVQLSSVEFYIGNAADLNFGKGTIQSMIFVHRICSVKCEESF